MVNKHLCLAAILALLPPAVTANPPNPAMAADELAFFQQTIPGSRGWHETAPGLFEGLKHDGSRIRLYTTEARDLYFSEREAQLAELITSVEHDSSMAEVLEDAIDAITSELSGHRAIMDAELDRVTLKNTQEFRPVFNIVGGFCSRIAYPSSTFHHVWYSANTTATLIPLGSGPQFGPPPPVPQSVYRYVHSQTGSNFDWIDDHWYPQAPAPQTISAYTSAVVFPNTCSMETQHSISALCHDGSSRFGSVTVQQSCWGVTNGIPPTQLP